MFKNHSIRNYITTLCVLLFSTTVFAQQNPKYSLLWKITGNGLSQPSYLFGTMHVKDNRVFHFSDSVMLALQSCSHFAMEVHPDTTMKSMFALMAGNDTLRSLEKLLSKKQYDQLNKKFQQKNGYPMGNINPIQLESSLNEEKKPDDKVTFIDAYLYGIARTLNKNIYGLEDAVAQINEYFGSTDELRYRLLELLDDNVTTGKDEAKEDMTRVYSTGDLDAIYKYILDNSIIDSNIIKRNKVMARSMIKYMANESLFTAVGAAHLPGPDGVIALLRKAGYTVTKVSASFTGVANTFHIDYMKMHWPDYKYEHMGYSISFPGEPIEKVVSGLNNEVYIDISNNTYYAVTIRQQDEIGDWHKIVDVAIKNYLSTRGNRAIILSKKNIIYQNFPCTELVVKDNASFMRVRFLSTNNLMYTITAGANKNYLNEPNFNRFFNSVQFFPTPKKEPAKWITYNNTTGAFSAKLPGQPNEIIKKVNATIQGTQQKFTLNLYVSTDSVNAKTYLVRYNDYPEGTYLKDKETVLDNLVQELKGKADFIKKPVKIFQNGLEGRKAIVLLAGGYYMSMRIFTKGNRVYVLLKETTKDETDEDNKPDMFFDSFKILPTIQPDYYTYKNDSANFSVQMVAKPVIKPDTSVSATSFLHQVVVSFATNPNSGGLYDFEYAKITPYYRVESIDSLYNIVIKDITKYDDTVLSKKDIMVNGLKAKEIIVLNKTTTSEKRMRLLQSGEYLYFINCYADSTEFSSKTCNSFYNSFTTLHTAIANLDITTSKAEKIYNDLGSKDTTVYKNALGALSYYKFTQDELPYVYKALQRNYPDDTTDDGARYKLIEQLSKVNTDSAISVLANLYNSTAIADYLKGEILSVIPKMNKKTGYDLYLRLLLNNPPLKIKNAYDAFYPLTDSVEYAVAHFNEVLPFIKYDNFRRHILSIAKNIANQNVEAYTKLIKTDYPEITKYATQDVFNYIHTKNDGNVNNEWGYTIYNYFQLANKINSPAYTLSFTDEYLKSDPKGLYAPDAITARIYNNLPNNKLLLNKFLDSLGTRYDIIDAYNDVHQLGKVALNYRKPVEYARLCFYQYIATNDDDYGSPDKIVLLGSILNKGSEYYVFKYLLTERDETNYLLGITGPYKPGSTKLNFKRYYAYTEYDIVKPNWRKQATALIKPLIDSYK